jgi:RNA polymerase sigma factor (sigma-70 family)
MDSTAVRGKLEACHPESFAWALNCCGRDRGEAEDVLQTVYLKVLDGRARFDGRSAFTTWLFAVIRRTAAEERRRRQRHRGWLMPLEEGSTTVATDPQPDEAVQYTELQVLLTGALARLSSRQREVLLLVFYHDRTIDEAAAIMGVGLGSARRHYARGKERLRVMLPETELVQS